MIDELNEQGVFIDDFYIMNYCGIVLFFNVCKTTRDSVCIVELGTKRYKNGVTLLEHFKVSNKPLVVLENNRISKSQYKVRPVILDDNEPYLPIPVKYGSPLYKEAEKRCSTPPVGVFFAKRIKDYRNKYWKNSEDTKKDEQQSFDA